MQGYGTHQFKLVRCSKPRSGASIKELAQKILSPARPHHSGKIFFNDWTIRCSSLVHPTDVLGCFALTLGLNKSGVPSGELKDTGIYSSFYVCNAQNWANFQEVMGVKDADYNKALKRFIDHFQIEEPKLG